MAKHSNSTKPNLKVLDIFDFHIANGTLAFLIDYHALSGISECVVKDCNNADETDTCFYNTNTVNEFHGFIKQPYIFYSNMASKYIIKQLISVIMAAKTLIITIAMGM